MNIDIKNLLKALPCSYPVSLVDKIIKLYENEIIGIKNTTMNEPFFQGHFPNHPIMPGVLILESMTQLGGVLLLKKFVKSNTIRFAQISRARFIKPVKAGETVLNKVRIQKVENKKFFMEGSAYVDNKLVAKSEFTAFTGKMENLRTTQDKNFINNTVPMKTQQIIANEKLLGIMPHRFPFLLIDKLIISEGGKSGIGIKKITFNEPYIIAESRTLPDTILLEIMTQGSRSATINIGKNKKGYFRVATGYDNILFSNSVRCGDTVVIKAVLSAKFLPFFRVKCVAEVDGKIIASGEINYALVRKLGE